MSSNKVKYFRARLKLSQRELASLAGTSQQQVQRIEAGTITTSLELANELCKALGQPLKSVFPLAARALADLSSSMTATRTTSDKDLSEVSQAGIEADPSSWFFVAQLRGHEESMVFPILPSEKRRLYSAVQQEGSNQLAFAVFDSGENRVAINLSELVFCQFLQEMFPVDADKPKISHAVRISPVGMTSQTSLKLILTS